MKKAFLFVLFLCTSLLPYEKFALIIGINDYQDEKINDLSFCESDAKNFKSTLENYAAFHPNNISLLTGQEATYLNIRKKIFALGNKAESDDKIFIFFSGHGTRIEDFDSGDEQDGLDEALCPYDTELGDQATVIADDELWYWLRRVKSNEIYLIFDCGFMAGSANFSDATVVSKGLSMVHTSDLRTRKNVTSNVDLFARDLKSGNELILTACDAKEHAYESMELRQGVFTYFLTEGLKGNADVNHDGVITSAEFIKYGISGSATYSQQVRVSQNPQNFGSYFDSKLALTHTKSVPLHMYDKDLKVVDLAIGRGDVKIGDFFKLKKKMGTTVSNEDRAVTKIKITQVRENSCEGQIVQEYFSNLQIAKNNYNDYYAEKILTGQLYIYTNPWARLFIDGTEIGPTPVAAYDLEEGNHTISFKIDLLGYQQPENMDVFIKGNETFKTNINFRRN